jgi:hypothetical protein
MLVLGQNFTGSSPPLVSANRPFALRLGKTYMALHMEFYGHRTTLTYWRHGNDGATSECHGAAGLRPPRCPRVLWPDDLYLEGGGNGQRIDVLSFDMFVHNLTGVSRQMTMDDDGNLRTYYWASDSRAWTSCGAYGLCVPEIREGQVPVPRQQHECHCTAVPCRGDCRSVRWQRAATAGRLRRGVADARV